MSPIVGLMLGGGLICLVMGAELLVRGASRLAVAIGISPLIIGLTVVAYGTSAPELAVSTIAAIESGQPGQESKSDIALGNVVGSNIFNVLFILGLSALIVPLQVAKQLTRVDVPIMIGVSLLLVIMALDGTIGRMDGVILCASLAWYTLNAIQKSRRATRSQKNSFQTSELKTQDSRPHRWFIQILWILIGLGFLVLGSHWLVDGAVRLARSWGVSELVIGLTMVAAGTSMPEVATSVMAGIRGHRDIAVGNVVGSNIFNILCVLGVSSLLSSQGITVSPSAMSFDIPIMIIVAGLCWPIFFSGQEISRLEGGMLFGYYILYTIYLILEATHSPHLVPFTQYVMILAVPAGIVYFTIGVIRTILNPANQSPTLHMPPI